MSKRGFGAYLVCLVTLCGAAARAQSAPAPGPDTVVLTDGETLLGRLASATGKALSFVSNAAGAVTLPWSRVRALRTTQRYAVIPAKTRVDRAHAATIPFGRLEVGKGELRVIAAAGAPPRTMPVAGIAQIVSAAEFARALGRPSWLAGWRGQASGGFALTAATQNNRSLNAALHVVRVIPEVSWLALRSRTSIDCNEAYGELTTPGTAAVKTSLFHLAAEQDWFLAPRWFAFGGGAWDHSFSQGLKLEQSYAGGAGWVVLRSSMQELDAKASVNYIHQSFTTASLDQNLAGSTLGETYRRDFAHGIHLDQDAAITPAWNDLHAYSAFARTAFTFPVYRRLGFTLGALDNFLNDPPPGFRKNSFQFTAGATYEIR